MLYNLMPTGGGMNAASSNSNLNSIGSVNDINNDNNDEQNAQNSSFPGNEDSGDKCRRPPFTMHGVLHYLQYEWSRFEADRAQWEMERAELRARISFLVGERKGQENLKRDLVRRIKMLEYSLKQERAKVYRLTHDGQDQVEEDSDDFNPGVNSNVPMDIDAIEKGSFISHTWKEARQILRQYLQEIGYSEKILDIRSFRVKNLLDLIPDNNLNNVNNERKSNFEKALLESEQAILETADIIKQSRKYNCNENVASSLNNAREYSGDDDCPSDNEEKNLDVEAVEALEEFSFLQTEQAVAPQKSVTLDDSDFKSKQLNSLDQSSFEQARNELRACMVNRKKSDTINVDNEFESARSISNDFIDLINEEKDEGRSRTSRRGPLTNLSVDSALGLKSDNDDIDIKDDFAMAAEDLIMASQQQRWNIRFTLRSHFDAIRAMQFHPVDPVLITASEDGTAKVWDLSNAIIGKLHDGKTAYQNQPGTGINDIEPFYTFRGHKGPILAMDMSSTGDMCYTGGYDGSICCWVVPSLHMEVYNNYDPTILQAHLTGHTDCIWALAFHSSTNRLISASADGTIRLWEAEVAEGMQSLVKTFVPPQLDSGEILRPRSIDIVSTEPQQLITAYSKAQCSILDLETGRNVLSFNFKDGSDENIGEINKVLSHPTMPVTVMAGEDRKIRIFDNNSGKLIDSAVAHVEGISTLAIDPNGLYLLSGSHDGSLRFWNLEKRICLQEITAHRKKYDMSVLTVAFHPSRPIIASAGADSLTKVFTTLNTGSGLSHSLLLKFSASTSSTSSTVNTVNFKCFK